MIRFFQSLRGKLILTYTLVTVMALLAVEVLVLGMMGIVASQTNGNKTDYLSDVIFTLYPVAQTFLQPGQENIPGLQLWLDQTYESGKASLDPQDTFDSPAAIIVRGEPMYVLSLDGTVIAQTPIKENRTPIKENSLVGRRYTPPDLPDARAMLKNASQGVTNPLWLSVQKPDWNYLMAVPIFQKKSDSAVVGMIILTVKPPPSLLVTLWPFFLGVVLFTAFVLLAAVAPFGALFGFIMSRGLTRRLKRLTEAADAWGVGDFAIQPQDRSKDEISYLGVRMRRMAERVQALLQSQHALALVEERNRLARELHDTVKQQNFATLMQVRAAKNLLDQGDAASARQRLDEAEGLIKTSQQELGLMIAELRPAALEGQGLAGALQEYVNTWSQHACIPATLLVQNEHSLPLEMEQAFYRVAQEALSNVARHSRATSVTIRLEYGPTQVTLTVTDNGAGFDPQEASNLGYGLQTMRERMAALDGKILVVSVPEKGAAITASAPLQYQSKELSG